MADEMDFVASTRAGTAEQVRQLRAAWEAAKAQLQEERLSPEPWRVAGRIIMTSTNRILVETVLSEPLLQGIKDMVAEHYAQLGIPVEKSWEQWWIDCQRTDMRRSFAPN